jgi:hypothetical protein
MLESSSGIELKTSVDDSKISNNNEYSIKVDKSNPVIEVYAGTYHIMQVLQIYIMLIKL